MKEDKAKPASKRQRRQAARLGVQLSDDDTVHSACRKINSAAQAEALAKKKECALQQTATTKWQDG